MLAVKSVDCIYIHCAAGRTSSVDCQVINVLDVLSSLVSELLAVSGILVLLTFVPGPKYMSDEKKSRRRFLSGSAAAPFIMTVHPGSVLAASSTSCFVKAGQQVTPDVLPDPVASGPHAPDPDFWLRKSVELLKLKDTTTNVELEGFYLKPFNDGSNYWKFVGNNVAPIQTLINSQALNPKAFSTSTYKQALLLVDNSGNVVGFQWETGIPGSGKITKSCYTSFKP